MAKDPLADAEALEANAIQRVKVHLVAWFRRLQRRLYDNVPKQTGPSGPPEWPYELLPTQRFTQTVGQGVSSAQENCPPSAQPDGNGNSGANAPSAGDCCIGAEPEQSATAGKVGTGEGTYRRAAVDAFILKCTQGTRLKATRTHIWRMAGHSGPRQFQFWQASDPKATAQDDQNFRRILAMDPTDFEALLKKKGIV